MANARDWSDNLLMTPSLSRPALALYLMNADGSGQRKITDEAPVDKDPRFSPDGSTIAWSSTTDDGPPAWRPCPER